MGDCRKLEDLFSIYDKIYFKSYLRILEYIPEQKKLIVPRGLDIAWLEFQFNTTAYIDTKYDSFDRTDIIRMKFLPRDDIQKEALAFMIGERNYNYTKAKSQLSLNLNTGKGKSYCSIAATAMSLVRSIIITSSISWLNQWKDYILEYTDVNEDEIYMLVGSPTIHRLLKRDMKKYKFILASHDTIKSYGDKYGWDYVTELFKHMKCGFKFFDEAHINFDNMAKIDFYTNTFKTFYITATPARSDRDENILFKYYFKNIPAIDLFDGENDPHTNYVAIRYNSKPTVVEINNCTNAYGFDRNKYSQYVLHKDNFYKMFTIVLDMAIRNGKKNVFYIATNNAIEHIYQWIIENFPELDGDVGIFTSIVDNKEEQLNNRIILSTTKSLGAAVDVKGLKMTCVLAEPFKSEVIAKQTLGRTRDDDTVYIDIVDTGFKAQMNYNRSKIKLFSKYAKSIKIIELSQKELDDKYKEIMGRRKIIKLINPMIIPNIINNKINPMIMR